jgi:hypothetical protein
MAVYSGSMRRRDAGAATCNDPKKLRVRTAAERKGKSGPRRYDRIAAWCPSYDRMVEFGVEAVLPYRAIC